LPKIDSFHFRRLPLWHAFHKHTHILCCMSFTILQMYPNHAWAYRPCTTIPKSLCLHAFYARKWWKLLKTREKSPYANTLTSANLDFILKPWNFSIHSTYSIHWHMSHLAILSINW
jgi:hypothetical protein